MTRPVVLPSSFMTESAPRMKAISRLNGWPMRSPVNASPVSSRAPAHDSGPMWLAAPSSLWTFTTCSLPVSRRTIKAMLNGSPPSNRNGRGPGVGSPNQNARALTYLDPSRASTPTPTRWPLSNRHREYHRDNRRRLTRTRRKLRHQRRSDRRLRHRRITRENQSGLILTSTIGLILESASGSGNCSKLDLKVASEWRRD